jgi:hypothetical protein
MVEGQREAFAPGAVMYERVTNLGLDPLESLRPSPPSHCRLAGTMLAPLIVSLSEGLTVP